jgi:hypothetical protein
MIIPESRVILIVVLTIIVIVVGTLLKRFLWKKPSPATPPK